MMKSHVGVSWNETCRELFATAVATLSCSFSMNRVDNHWSITLIFYVSEWLKSF